MLNQFEQPKFNKYISDMRPQPSNTHLNSTGEIECSIKNVNFGKHKNRKPMKTTKKQKMQEKMTALLKASSSLKSMLNEISPAPFQKIPSVSVLSPVSSSSERRPISMPLITNNLQEKYSIPLFSESLPLISATQLGQRFDSPISVKTLNQSVSSRHLSQNSQIDLNLEEQLNNEWSNLNQQLTPINTSAKSKLQRNVSQNSQHSRSSMSETILNESLVSPAGDRSLHDSRIDDLDVQIQPIHRRISREELSSHSSFSGVTMMQPQNSDFDVQINDIFGDVKEHIETQKIHRNYLADQNHNISMQIQKFECYVRDKIEQTEVYMKQKLSQFEDSNGIIINALNDIKDMEREHPVRINENGPGLPMPKLPISKAVSLVILNNALKNTHYMEQFVSEISRVVTLYVYNPRKSVKSVMTKLFTLNLLAKYCWTERSSKTNLPEFSALKGVLRAISRVLTNYMSDRDMRREIRYFFEQIPRIYEQKKAQYS